MFISLRNVATWHPDCPFWSGPNLLQNPPKSIKRLKWRRSFFNCPKIKSGPLSCFLLDWLISAKFLHNVNQAPSTVHCQKQMGTLGSNLNLIQNLAVVKLPHSAWEQLLTCCCVKTIALKWLPYSWSDAWSCWNKKAFSFGHPPSNFLTRWRRSCTTFEKPIYILPKCTFTET